jgi:uncharacterized protein
MPPRTLVNRLTAALAALGLSLAAWAQPAAQEIALTLNTATGTLHGSLLMPAAAQPMQPVVLIIAGSGATDRDGNSAGLPGPNYSLKLLAQGLAQGGWASLRYDKRGVAASAAAGPREADLRFVHYVQDAAAWLRLLRADGRFGALVVLGHSEGSLIGMLAAKDAGADGLVSLAGPAPGAATVLRTQLAGKLPPTLAARNEAVLVSLERGETVADTPPELGALYRPSVQPYLISWFRYEPKNVLSGLPLTLPVLVLQGSTDIQVGVADAQTLQAARAGVELGVIAGMNHVLKAVPADLPSQLASYSNPALPLAAGLVPRLLQFLQPLAALQAPAPKP